MQLGLLLGLEQLEQGPFQKLLPVPGICFSCTVFFGFSRRGCALPGRLDVLGWGHIQGRPAGSEEKGRGHGERIVGGCGREGISEQDVK